MKILKSTMYYTFNRKNTISNIKNMLTINVTDHYQLFRNYIRIIRRHVHTIGISLLKFNNVSFVQFSNDSSTMYNITYC